MKHSLFTLTILAGLLSGCVNLAPNYSRPDLPVPAAVDGAKSSQTSKASVPKWQDLVVEDRLKKVIQLALDNNRNLRIAGLDVDKARATYRITDADRFPTVQASGSDTISKTNGKAINRSYTAEVGFSAYELDFFSRLKNLSQADFESYLATDATQRSTRLTLIAEVASDWLTLASDKQLLKLAKETYETRQKTLALTQKQKELGGASALTLAQEEASAESAHDDVHSYTSQVEQDLNALTLLVGTGIPEDFLPTDDDSLNNSVASLVDVPAGLSSDVLLQRPDIISAEHTLKATYADIGAARAAFFPKISLTAEDGTTSGSLNNLFKAGTRTWSFAPSISVPIFNGGSLRASLDSAKIERDIQIATYEKAIQTAFEEVANAMSVRKVLNDRLDAQRKQVAAYEKALSLTNALFKAGSDSYLDVLDSQRSLYSAQQSLISLQLTEQTNRITLFKVLGGS
jgi:outer membrane protein, multidrug efflux system